MRTKIKDILSEDLNEYVSMCHGLLFIDHVHRFPTYVRDIETPFDELQDEVINGSPRAPAWLVVLTIQTSMLIEGVVEIVKEVTTDIEIRNHLKSKPVWGAALALINILNENKTEPDLPGDASAKYEAFLKIIVGSTNITLPESYMKLMKKVGHIRRPFQAQATTVVMLCRFLANKFSTFEKSARTIENFNSLEEAFNHTLVVLDGATQAVPELKNFDMSDFENHETVRAFGDAEAIIRESFQYLNLKTEWTQKQTELSSAIKKDRDRLTKLHTILNRGPSSPPAKVKVNVTIHEDSPDETELETTSGALSPCLLKSRR
ncbi:hypothetical protein BGY98DRAFT_107616 [Russula aff. rugulosa BPL654]|nr:hypothetical protein BGY98DRAFT_107616 [Russula aff. rugulosa BPL654]